MRIAGIAGPDGPSQAGRGSGRWSGAGLGHRISEILVPGSYGFALRDESPAGPFDGLHPISADGKIVKNL